MNNHSWQAVSAGSISASKDSARKDRTNEPIHTSGQLADVGVAARFLQIDGARFFVRGVSYGSFAEQAAGVPFPPVHIVSKDFECMRAAGINTVRLYDLPPTWLLDMAQAAGLRVILGFPWSQHICLDAQDRRGVVRQVYKAARTHACHPAVLLCCVGNEIPSSIVRWYGKEKTERFIGELCQAVREAAPHSLVTYANYPTTEYLELPFLDVVSYNVYLDDPADFCKYLMRLHTSAGDRPLLLTEVGTDSLRAGEEGQAAFLHTQLKAAFEHGVCGAVTFSWTDEWFRGGRAVDDWAFGLVDEARTPKPAYFAVQKVLPQAPFDPARRWPGVTVVVAAYNAAATLDECLASLRRLNYPNYEVVVVNDGSRDATGEIAERYASPVPIPPQAEGAELGGRIRVVHTQNQGLSAARNLGLAHARGEIVAYTDSDCIVDPDWLRYVALALVEKPLAGVGGPNYTPGDDGWVARCVGVAPGNPEHILLDNEIAEHIPGCNMAFWRTALEEVGGFHPDFRVAGDDVDICWRLQDRGYQIGFAPTAFVWHRRRNSIRAFLRQQIGYGRSEAILEAHHAHRFNRLGHMRWRGSIYGSSGLLRLRQKVRIYFGEFGTAPFQMLESSPPAWWVYLPQTAEWHLMALLCLAAVFFLPWVGLLGVAALATTLGQAVYLGWATPLSGLSEQGTMLRGRAIVGLLNWLQPLARSWGRLQGGLGPFGLYRARHPLSSAPASALVASRPQKTAKQMANPAPTSTEGARQTPIDSGLGPAMGMGQGCRVAYWSETGCGLEEVLRKLLAHLYRQRAQAETGDGWQPWDIRIKQLLGVRATLYSAIEYHGGPRCMLRFRIRTQVARWAYLPVMLLVVGLIGGVLGTWQLFGLGSGMSHWFFWALPLLWLGGLLAARRQLVARVVDSLAQVVEEFDLTPVHEKRPAAIRPPIQPRPEDRRQIRNLPPPLPTLARNGESHPAHINGTTPKNKVTDLS